MYKNENGIPRDIKIGNHPAGIKSWNRNECSIEYNAIVLKGRAARCCCSCPYSVIMEQFHLCASSVSNYSHVLVITVLELNGTDFCRLNM